MGHVPSSELVTEPMIVDLRSTRSRRERVAAVALCKENFPSVEDPLFQKFVAVRNEVPVRYWYCADPSTVETSAVQTKTGLPKTEIAQCPTSATPEYIYSKFVADASKLIDRQPAKENWRPLPVCFIRLADPDRTAINKEQDEVIGYLGCRHFGQNGEFFERGSVGVFLARTFQNESKALSLTMIACRCYAHFCKVAGIPEAEIPWPKTYQHECLRRNLPALRLIQKLHFLTASQFTEEELKDRATVMTVRDTEIRIIMEGPKVAGGCAILAAKVEHSTRPEASTCRSLFFLRSQCDPPKPKSSDWIEGIDDVVAEARAKWSDAASIVERQAALVKSRGERKENKTNPFLGSSQSQPTSVAHSRTNSSEIDAPQNGSARTNDPYAPTKAIPTPQQGTSQQLSSSDSSGSRTPSEDGSLTSLQRDAAPPSNFDPNWIFLGDMAPIYVSNSRRDWCSVFWRDAMTPLRISSWQPHQGFVCIEVPKTELSIYSEAMQPCTMNADAPLIFLDQGQTYYKFDFVQGRYDTHKF